MNKIFKNNKIVAFILFLLSFSIYSLTLAPSLYVEDSAELVTAAAVLGIAHPPGYPLFTLIGKIFILLTPFGSVAFKVNLVSAFFGALTISILYLILAKIKINRFIGFFVSLSFAFSSILWQEATYTEVYTLNIFFVALTLYFLLDFWESKREKSLLFFSFCYGLSLTNHYSMLALAPGYTLLIILAQPKIWQNWKLILRMIALFVLPLSLYFYLPLRSLANPPLDWYNPEDTSNLYKMLRYDIATGHRIGLGTIDYFGEFAFNIFEQFELFFTVAGIIGLIVVYLKDKKLFAGLFSCFFLASLGIIIVMTNGAPLIPGMIWFLSILYLPAYLIFALFIARGFNFLWLITSSLKKKNIVFAKYLLLTLIVITPFYLLFLNWPKVDKSNYFYVYDYYKQLLFSLEPESILILKDQSLNGDAESFSLLYFQAVENLRPDITIISDSPLFYRPEIIKLPFDYYNKSQAEKRSFLINEILDSEAIDQDKAIYTTFPADVVIKDRVASRSNGYAYKLYFPATEALVAVKTATGYKPLNIKSSTVNFDHYTREFLAKYFYHQASFFWENGQKNDSFYFLNQAIQLDNQPFSWEFQDFINHRSNWDTLSAYSVL